MNPAFARGCRGDLVELIQAGLKIPHPDGDFGKTTEKAVRAFQAQQKLTVTGRVDPDTWKKLTGRDWPDAAQRHTQLTAAFEGHNYTKPAGNWDKAGITWGIIGFTLVVDGKKASPKAGSLHALLRKIREKHPVLIKDAFGDLYAILEKQLLDAEVTTVSGVKKMQAFAEGISIPPFQEGDPAFGPAPKPPDPNRAKQLKRCRTNRQCLTWKWEQAFERLGGYPEIRLLQRAGAAPYLKKAMELALNYELSDNEVAVQFFYDVAVNNGGFFPKEAAEIAEQIASAGPAATWNLKLTIIKDVLKKHRPLHAKDIEERKGTILNGTGTVHRTPYSLDAWGIRIPDVPKRIHLNLGLIPDAETEAFAVGLRTLKWVDLDRSEVIRDPLAQAQADLAAPIVNQRYLQGANPKRFQTFDWTDFANQARRLIRPDADAADAPDAPETATVIPDLLFRDPVAVLTIGSHHVWTGSYPVASFVRGTAPGSYAGWAIGADGEFRLLAKAGTFDREESGLIRFREALAQCSLVFLSGSNGIPFGLDAQDPDNPRLGLAWQDFLSVSATGPLVLGWFGRVEMPGLGAEKTAAALFLQSLQALGQGLQPTPGRTQLETLLADHGLEVIQRWGQACFAAYGKSKTYSISSRLWRRRVELGPGGATDPIIDDSGAAAISPAGEIYVANPNYPTGNAMIPHLL